MKLLSLILILILWWSPPQKSKCPSQPALEEDSPKGANQTIDLTAGTVKKIQGRVVYTTGDPVKEAVVEIYEYSAADRELEASDVVKSKERRAACLADNNGYFCFTGLSSGTYAIRAGTRHAEGMNEIFAKVKLDRRWWMRWLRSGKNIELMIQPGT